jgi:hypothetical protein
MPRFKVWEDEGSFFFHLLLDTPDGKTYDMDDLGKIPEGVATRFFKSVLAKKRLNQNDLRFIVELAINISERRASK